MAFGARVRTLRKAKGFSQERLAQRAGLHTTYIGAVERGKRNLSVKSVQKIAAGLCVDISSLFYFAGKGPREKVIMEIMQQVALKKRSQQLTILKIIKSL